jgi:hypothetical protein
MNSHSFNIGQTAEAAGFDLARLSKSKDTVDICPNTIRSYAKRGLPLYHQGKAVFFSKAELTMFIRTSALPPVMS